MRTPPVADVPSVAHARSRREGPPADPLGFSALLTKTTARTAPAEGHIKKLERDRPEHPEHPEHPVHPDHPVQSRRPEHAGRPRDHETSDAPAPQEPAPGTDAPASAGDEQATGEPASPTVPGATAPEPATEAGGSSAAPAVVVGGTTAAPAASDPPTAEAGGVTIGTAGAPASPAPDADDLPVAPGATTTTPAPAAGTGEPVTDGATTTPATPDEATTPGVGTGTTPTAEEPVADDGAPATPQGPPAHAQAHGHGRPGEDELRLPPGLARRAEVHEAHGAEAATPASASGTPVATPAHGTAPAGVPAATPSAPAVPTTPVPVAGLPAAWVSRGMAQTVERLNDLVHVATARGVARAKIQLHPQELGNVEVRLRTSAEGLVASITAQNAEAVEAVTQAGAELRRSLEERGVTIARLDIQLAAGGETRHGWQRQDAPGQVRKADRAGATGDTTSILDATEPVAPAASAVPAGVLVDVHA